MVRILDSYSAIHDLSIINLTPALSRVRKVRDKLLEAGELDEKLEQEFSETEESLKGLIQVLSAFANSKGKEKLIYDKNAPYVRSLSTHS